MPSGLRLVVIGLVFVFGVNLLWRFGQSAPAITVAWGNALAERERRLAAEDARRAEDKKTESARLAEIEDYNESHCKVTVDHGWGIHETITNVRRIHSAGISRGTWIVFGGGVERLVDIVKTEDCR